jgi:hypothetical protein
LFHARLQHDGTRLAFQRQDVPLGGHERVQPAMFRAFAAIAVGERIGERRVCWGGSRASVQATARIPVH